MRSLLLILLAGPVLAQDTPLAVVKAAIEAHGGAEALNKARIARTTAKGTIFERGREIPFSAIGNYSIEKYRIETTAEDGSTKISMTQIVNGKKSKVISKLNGVEQAVDAKALQQTVQAALLQEVSILTPLLDPKKYALKLDKEVDISGSPAQVVAVSGNGITEVKLFFDKKSHRLVKTSRKALANGPNGVVECEEETILSDFKPFDKALLPTAMLVNHDGKKFMTATVSEWKFLDKIDDKEFAVE